MSLDNPFVQNLRLHPEYADQFRAVTQGKLARHHHLEWAVFEQLDCIQELRAAISHPNWRTLLTIEEPTYTELVWEFYTIFKYYSKAPRDTYAVTFRLGGYARELTIDGLAYALGIEYHPFNRHEVEIPHPTDWNQDEFYRRIARLAHGYDYFDPGQTYVRTLSSQWHILNLLITRSIVPNVTGSHKIPKRVLYAMYSKGYPEHMLHLGSFEATTFSRCHGKPNHLYCGPLITRLARHFDISFQGLHDSSARGGSTPLSREVLHNALLLKTNGTRTWVDGLSMPPEEAVDLDDGEEEDEDDDDDGAMDGDEPEPPLSPPGELRPRRRPGRGESFSGPSGPSTSGPSGPSMASGPSMDFFTEQFQQIGLQFQQLGLQTQQLMDHQVQFYQQYSAHQAEYQSRLTVVDKRLGRLETHMGVTGALIERERDRGRRLMEYSEHLLQACHPPEEHH
ncbi:unnamed protein product [Linum trigynum]|uniref:Aminotransferase-like plant mobile domain-containing protein n=1 Tax=Linum trigynum TaxID=586398 RepID=A0AAV2FCZ4_9ROSI